LSPDESMLRYLPETELARQSVILEYP
jgi:hypothetical protein